MSNFTWVYTLDDQFSAPARNVADAVQQIDRMLHRVARRNNTFADMGKDIGAGLKAIDTAAKNLNKRILESSAGVRIKVEVDSSEIDAAIKKLDELEKKSIAIKVKTELDTSATANAAGPATSAKGAKGAKGAKDTSEAAQTTAAPSTSASPTTTGIPAKDAVNVSLPTSKLTEAEKETRRYEAALKRLGLTLSDVPKNLPVEDVLTAVRKLKAAGIKPTKTNIGKSGDLLAEAKIAATAKDLGVSRSLYTGQDSLAVFSKKIRMLQTRGIDPATQDLSGSLDVFLKRLKEHTENQKALKQLTSMGKSAADVPAGTSVVDYVAQLKSTAKKQKGPTIESLLEKEGVTDTSAFQGMEVNDLRALIKKLKVAKLPVTSENLQKTETLVQDKKISTQMKKAGLDESLYSRLEPFEVFMKKISMLRSAKIDPSLYDLSGSLDDFSQKLSAHKQSIRDQKKTSESRESAQRKYQEVFDKTKERMGMYGANLAELPKGVSINQYIEQLRRADEALRKLSMTGLHAQSSLRLGTGPELPVGHLFQKLEAEVSPAKKADIADMLTGLSRVQRNADVSSSLSVQGFQDLQRIENAKLSVEQSLAAEKRIPSYRPLLDRYKTPTVYSTRTEADGSQTKVPFQGNLRQAIDGSMGKLQIDWQSFWTKLYMTQFMTVQKMSRLSFDPAAFMQRMNSDIGASITRNYTGILGGIRSALASVTLGGNNFPGLLRIPNALSLLVGATQSMADNANQSFNRFILRLFDIEDASARVGRTFRRNLAGVNGGLGALISGFGKSNSGVMGSLSTSDSIFGKMAFSLGSAVDKMAMFGAKAYFALYAFRALFYLTKELTAGVTNMAMQAVDSVNFVQRSRVTLNAIMTETDKDRYGSPEKVTGDFMMMAETLGVDPRQLMSTAVQVRGAGFKMPEVPIVTQAIMDAASLSSTPNEATQGVVRAITQIKNAPVLRMEELEQLREHLAPIGVGRAEIFKKIAPKYEDPATKKPYTAEKMTELITSHEIGIDKDVALYALIEAIIDKTGGKKKQAGTLTKDMKGTVGRQMAMIQSRPFTMTAAFENTTGMRAFSDVLQNILDITGPLTDKGKEFSGIFNAGMSEVFMNIFGAFTGEKGQTLLFDLMKESMVILVNTSRIAGAGLGIIIDLYRAMAPYIANMLNLFVTVVQVLRTGVQQLLFWTSPIWAVLGVLLQVFVVLYNIYQQSAFVRLVFDAFLAVTGVLIGALSVIAVIIGMIALYSFIANFTWIAIGLAVVFVVGLVYSLIEAFVDLFRSTGDWSLSLDAVWEKLKGIFDTTTDIKKLTNTAGDVPVNNKGISPYITPVTPAEQARIEQSTGITSFYNQGEGITQPLYDYAGMQSFENYALQAPPNLYMKPEAIQAESARNQWVGQQGMTNELVPFQNQAQFVSGGGEVSFIQGLNQSLGFASGIQAGMPAIQAAAGNSASMVGDTTAQVTQTHSPSQVQFEYGYYQALGFGLGIEAGQKDVQNATEGMLTPLDMAAKMDESAQKRKAAGMGGRPGTMGGGGDGAAGGGIKVEINIENVSGDPESFIRMLEEQLPTALDSMLQGYGG